MELYQAKKTKQGHRRRINTMRGGKEEYDVGKQDGRPVDQRGL